jgi:DNA transformation protein
VRKQQKAGASKGTKIMSASVAAMKNIGEKTAQWLEAAGVDTPEKLAEIGAVGAYEHLKAAGVPVSMNFVYAVEGALLDIHWTDLPLELKQSLKKQCGK